tara:strand:+ start:538 stop:837 length:300 start_codon:yes stop_codon:yes gene_type:complete
VPKLPVGGSPPALAPAPPAPTAIGNADAVSVTLFVEIPYPSKGLAVKGAEGELTSLKPPAPAPPPIPPPPPPTIVYETIFSGDELAICETQKVPGPVKV